MAQLLSLLTKIYQSSRISQVVAVLSVVSWVSPKAKRLQVRLLDIQEYRRGSGVSSIDSGRKATEKYNGAVLYCVHSVGCFHPSGYTSRSMAVLQALQRRGVKVTALARPGYPWDLKASAWIEKIESIKYQGVTFRLFPDAKFTLKAPESVYIDTYADTLVSVARGTGSTVIHASSNYLNGSAAAIAGRKLRVPSVYEVRGLWHLTRAFYNPRYEGSDHYLYCEQREVDACGGVDRVLTLSDGLKAWMVERGIPAGKIDVVGNAAFLPEPHNADDVDPVDLRRCYNLPPGVPIVGYLGSVVAYEGLDLVIRLMAKTPEPERPYLLVIGAGSHKASLQKLAHSESVASHVVFVGRVEASAVSAHYRLMDLVVLPRKESPLTRIVPPIKPFEILAHGRPLVISKSVANALGSTLSSGYSVVDFEQLDSITELLRMASPPSQSVLIPNWDDRAEQIMQVYESFR